MLKYFLSQIEPREPPTVELYPSTVQTVTLDESVLFQCRYMSGNGNSVNDYSFHHDVFPGIPTPVITWTRDGADMPDNAQILSGGVLK